MSRQVVAESVPSKRLQPAFAVQAGVSAALLAARGAPGPAGWLDGEFGVLALAPDRADALEVLHRPAWEVGALSLKPYPACRYAHAAIEAVRGAPLHELESVKVHVPAGAGYAMVSRPFAWRGQPVVDAQFSIPWLVAAALRTGTVDLRTLHPEVLGDPEIERLAYRVRVHQDLPARTAMAPAEVRLSYVDGLIAHRKAEMPSMRSFEQVTAKARACAAAAGLDDWTFDAMVRFADAMPELDACGLRYAASKLSTKDALSAVSISGSLES